MTKLLSFSEYILVSLAFACADVTWSSYGNGLAVISSGVVLSIWCAGHSRPGRVEGGDISGPWLFVRHPDMVARFLCVFGFILMTRVSWMFVVAMIFLGVQYRAAVHARDADLARWLGPVFAPYRLFVPSFLPQFLPARLPQQSIRMATTRFSWSGKKALKRRALLGAWVSIVAALLWVALTLKFELSVWWVRGVGCVIAAGAILWLGKRVAMNPYKYIKSLTFLST